MLRTPAPLKGALGVGRKVVMTEKQRIEFGTADGFLQLYNAHFGTSYEIVAEADAPDIRCVDANGRKLNIEVTTTEDSPGDIPALLGRSDKRSIESLAENNRAVRSGLVSPRFTSAHDAAKVLASRIDAKLRKDYGNGCALVVRDTSGCDWEWDLMANDVVAMCELKSNPFDKGIWVISRTKDKLFEIVAAKP